jgi:hypothetical protein
MGSLSNQCMYANELEHMTASVCPCYREFIKGGQLKQEYDSNSIGMLTLVNNL